MSQPIALTLGNRTVSILLDPSARYALATPLPWHLFNARGQEVRKGVAKTTVLFLDRLDPSTDYTLKISDTALRFTTQACAGLVEASEFGASKSIADNRIALTEAIAAVPEGGTLRIRAGRHVTSPIFLKSNMTLLLDDGAELCAIGNRDAWPQLPARDDTDRPIGTWEGLPERAFAAVVTAIDCNALTITGRGTINGGGDKADWWDWPKETRDGARRPRTLHLAYCRDTVLSGLTVCNSPSWTIHPYRCETLCVSALRVVNPKDSPNTDGLNPESCRDVDIVGVSFSVGDDCIAIKAGKRAPGVGDHLAPCEDITVRHCEMRFGHGAVVLGSEMSGDIRRVRIENCDFTQTDRGLRLKTRRGRGGTIEAVTMRNVRMERVDTPFAANAFYFCDADGKSDWVQSRHPAAVDETTPIVRSITLDRVVADDVTLAAAAILGLPEAPFSDITLSDFHVTYDPTAESDVPLMALGVPKVRHGGVLAEFATLSGDITLRTEEAKPKC